MDEIRDKTRMIDFDFSEIGKDIEDVIKIIECCDCDCDEMNGFKICGRCQAIIILKEINTTKI